MSRNPFVNALAAVGYIALVASGFSLLRYVPEPVTPLLPALGFLSLFVLSAAITGYLILGTPLQLFLEGNKKEAITFFFKTLGAFVLLAVALFATLLLLSI